MKLIEGTKARYLLLKEKISEYEHSDKDYFMQQDPDNNFVVNLFFIKDNKAEKVTSLSKETAEKISEKELESYIKKAGFLKEKIIKEKTDKNESKNRL